MSLKDLEQKSIGTSIEENKGLLGLSGKAVSVIGAMALSINLALAEPNKTIGIVSFETGGTAELYIDNSGKYQIRNGNSKNGSDLVYGKALIGGEYCIVYSGSLENNLEVFLVRDLEIYKEYFKKYGKKAYELVKSREQYLSDFKKKNPNSSFEDALKGWEIELERIVI